MVDGLLRGRFRIPGDDRLEDVRMLASDRLGLMGVAQKTPMRLGGLRQQRVLRGIVDQAMEGRLLPNLLGDVATGHGCIPGPQDRLAELSRPLSAHLDCDGREARGESVEHRADVVVVAHQPEIERRHLNAAPAYLRKHAIGLQKRHCLLHGLARDIEPGGDLLLHEMRARLDRAIADLVEDRLVDPLGEAGADGKRNHDNLNSEF